jgi:GTPase
MHNLPIIAIVGEPNVGKSTLLNKIAGKPLAVTSEIAGTTRDRQYIDTSWNGVAFTLVDTAGITFSNDELEQQLNAQIDVAVAQADIIMLVVDGKQPVRSLDQKALLKFRKLKKPTILAINKVDSPKTFSSKAAEFQKLGIKTIFPISAINGRGLGDLLDAITTYLEEHGLTHEPVATTTGIAVSIIGKPNVGKSSLFNKIIKEERVVVSPIPGTTRTAIDTHITLKGDVYTFIDTAGLKKKDFRQAQPDIYAGFQTFKAIRRSDIALLVIDATQEITKQDQHIAQDIMEMDKGLIIVANKADLYDGDEDKLRNYVTHHFPFLWMSPMYLVSAKTGQGLVDLLNSIKPIFEARHKTVSQDDLDRVVAKRLKQNPPKLLRDQRKPKVFGLKQIDTNPPMFELIVNYPAAISQQFRDTVKNAIIKELDFWGTPITLKLKGKDKK